MSSRSYTENVPVTANAHVDSSSTFTVVTAEIDSGTFKGAEGLGASKRNNEDPVNFETGYTLAFVRALRDLADSLEKKVLR